MKKIILFVFSLLLTFNTLSAQNWDINIGGGQWESGEYVQETNDGGYIIMGTQEQSVYLHKTDINGLEEWSVSLGGADTDRGYSGQQTNDGGYIICGYTYSYGSGQTDVYLIKTDQYGQVQWSNTFGGADFETGNSVKQTTDGGYIIVGTTHSFGNGYSDVYLIKTDANGNSLWTKTFGGDGYDTGRSVELTSDGGYIISGTVAAINGVIGGYGQAQDHLYLLKTDGNGDEQWFKAYGDYNAAFFAEQTQDGGYIITGYTAHFGSPGNDIFLMKTDINGDSLWTNIFGGELGELAHYVQQTIDGGYIICGRTDSYGSGYHDAYIIKTDINGDSLWTNTFGGANNDVAHCIKQTSDGGYIVTGYTTDIDVNSDIYLIKTDANGGTVAYGCTDSLADNYDATVNFDDGSCTYTSNCGSDVTGMFVSDIIDDRVVLNWDNMNTYDVNGTQICRLDKLRIKYRPIGTNTWLWGAMGDPAGYDANGFCNSTQVVSKARYQLDMNTTYEWWMRAWYCSGEASNWVEGPQFTTADECPVVGNLSVVSFTNVNNGVSEATFTWDDSNGPYVFCRIKIREEGIANPVAADWINVGGGSIPYGTYTAVKYGLTPGQSYRGQAKGHCDTTGHPAYNSLTWTPLIFWTQPSLRIEGGTAITNLDVYPNPSRDVFNISFTSESVQDLRVRVLNVVGAEVMKEDLQQFVGEYVKSINLNEYNRGIYFLEIETNGGVINKKLILQ